VSAPLHGLAAEFRDADALRAAVARAKAAGYARLEAFGPYPLADVAEALGAEPARVPVIAVLSGLVGAALTYTAQVWLNAVDYPLNVGGRPLHAWPAFLPATFFVAMLWTGAAALLGFLVSCRLPRLNHAMFAVAGFERATEDRFFLLVGADDPRFDEGRTAEELGALGPLAVRIVPCA
jgi:hypothetical protein